jgi:hypothetical protein
MTQQSLTPSEQAALADFYAVPSYIERFKNEAPSDEYYQAEWESEAGMRADEASRNTPFMVVTVDHQASPLDGG